MSVGAPSSDSPCLFPENLRQLALQLFDVRGLLGQPSLGIGQISL